MDPLLIGAKKLRNTVIPWECIPITSPYQFKVMDERYRTCSINNGMTFAREKDGLFEIIAVGAEQKTDWGIFVENKKNIEFMTAKLKFFLERALLWKK
jgi:hypothetical protein